MRLWRRGSGAIDLVLDVVELATRDVSLRLIRSKRYQTEVVPISQGERDDKN